MGTRIGLQTVLEDLLGSRNVYFQPPPTVQMRYPCIRYERSSVETEFADNKPYSHAKRYTVTVITTDPDSDIPNRVADLPYCRYDRFYTADNLNHDVFNLFF